MMRVVMAPARYVQGPGAMGQIGEIAKGLGRQPIVLVDAGIADRAMPVLQRSFRAQALPLLVMPFTGEVTAAALDALAQQERLDQPDLVIGIGGGKALDAAKGLALRLRLDVMTVPTIASTDAPASRGLVLYDTDHRITRVEQLPRNPVCVLVDTSWIAAAPVRFMRAGIGDAISKKFEVRACALAGGLNKHGHAASLTALAMADACYATLRAHGASAIEATLRGVPDAALEAVVEACVLMSALAFENGGLSLAHAMVTGLAQMRGVADRLHGEHVAYGLLLQLALEGEGDAVLRELMDFLRSVGLPVSLGGLGLVDVEPEALQQIARISLASRLAKHSLVPLSLAKVVEALWRVEGLSTAC